MVDIVRVLQVRLLALVAVCTVAAGALQLEHIQQGYSQFKHCALKIASFEAEPSVIRTSADAALFVRASITDERMSCLTSHEQHQWQLSGLHLCLQATLQQGMNSFTYDEESTNCTAFVAWTTDLIDECDGAVTAYVATQEHTPFQANVVHLGNITAANFDGRLSMKWNLKDDCGVAASFEACLNGNQCMYSDDAQRRYFNFIGLDSDSDYSWTLSLVDVYGRTTNTTGIAEPIVLNGFIVTGGNDGSQRSASVESHNGAPLLPNLPIGVTVHTLTAVGTVLYNCGGFTNAGPTDKCYTLDLSNPSPSWQQTLTLPIPMRSHTAVAVGYHIWFVFVGLLHDLDTNTGQFVTHQLSFSVNLDHCSVSNATHAFLIGVGDNFDDVWVNEEAYDPTRWIKLTTTGTYWVSSGCLLHEGYIYSSGGRPNTFKDYVAVFEANTGEMVSNSTLLTERGSHKMLVIDGKPAVVGGSGKVNGNFVFRDKIEVYIAANNSWQIHNATLSTDRSGFGIVFFSSVSTRTVP